MKILISSRSFFPDIGGAENSAEILATEFVNLGNEVKLITQSTYSKDLKNDDKNFDFKIIRKPNFLSKLRLAYWCDVFMHNGISIRDAWPLLFIKRLWVIRHNGWIRQISSDNDSEIKEIGGSSKGFKVFMKHYLTKYAVSISISHAISNHLKFPSKVIPNPYRESVFRIMPEIRKTKDLVFLGRLVSEKGLQTLLESLIELRIQKLFPNLTIIGKGPEEERLKKYINKYGLVKQVNFVGTKRGKELSRLLNQHLIMIVPSLYDEPFGVVALEGIACGCVVIGSEGGGLKDSIGRCGITFPNGDSKALADAINILITNPEKIRYYRSFFNEHIMEHKPNNCAKQYINEFEKHL